MRHKLAAPLALTVAVAVFFGVFALTRSLLWAPVLAALAALGMYLMLDDRTPVEVHSDDYLDEANRKVDEALRLVREVGRMARAVREPAARTALESAVRYVPELLDRVKARSPNSLYSTASQLGGHLASLTGAVQQYLDIESKPELYADPQALKRSGEQAFGRFADFALDSIRLVNQGDLAQYQANLQTVAPPKLPELG